MKTTNNVLPFRAPSMRAANDEAKPKAAPVTASHDESTQGQTGDRQSWPARIALFGIAAIAYMIGMVFSTFRGPITLLLRLARFCAVLTAGALAIWGGDSPDQFQNVALMVGMAIFATLMLKAYDAIIRFTQRG